MILRWAAPFFFAPQRPLQTPPVNGDVEPVLNRLEAGDGRQARLGRSQGLHILENRGGQLVPFFGPTVLGKQTDQAGVLECSLGLIDGGARHPKRGRHIDNRRALDAVSAQHFVADLEQILGIEKWILFEQSVGNRVGPRVEGASPFQLQCFLIGLFQFGPSNRLALIV